jgi:hypothetical protein
VLGDSVVFGFLHDESQTISNLLQAELDSSRTCTRVLKFGLGGLNFEEILEFLRIKDDAYDIDEAIFLVIPNDYARRESIYEGADNGLYRTYRRPTIVTPFFVREAIYRWKKREGSAPVRWYRWMYEGNAEWGAEQIRRIAETARERDIHLSAMLLPSRAAYQDGGYVLADMYAGRGAVLDRAGIPYMDPTETFAADPARFPDETDHPGDDGNVLIAGLMFEFLDQQRDEARPVCSLGSSGRTQKRSP